MLDYKLLEALAAVVNEGGFDKAAKKLHITQSAVSQRVKLMEEQAGQILVSRVLPPKATAKGKQFLKHYNKVKRLEDDLLTALEVKDTRGFQVISIGLNADSLATWFVPAICELLKTEKVTLDLKVDDQDETHKMLRDGDVAGCISSESSPVQGCSVEYIGTMNYRLAATGAFTKRYFKSGIDEASIKKAPAVIFNRKDDIHHQFLKLFFKRDINDFPIQYVPSSQEFVDFIAQGLGYGMIPDLQGKKIIQCGELKDLVPECHIKVNLYWHRWNLKSRLLDAFSKEIVKKSVIC